MLMVAFLLKLEVNECLSDPCQNGGICEDLFDKYECDCLPGYDGVLCENGTDLCVSTVWCSCLTVAYIFRH